jgi:hypothetical protein
VLAKETTNFYTYRLEAGGEVKGIPEGYISDAPWSWEDAEDTKVLPNGSWSHLALTYDGANMRLYVNASLVSTRAAPKPTIDGLKLMIGGYHQNFYEGLIDELRVYNRALSAAEIGTDMNSAVVSSGPSDSTPPSPPANLSATGSLGKVTLGWGASTDNVGVSGYEVYRSTTAGFTPAAANRIATPTATSYVDTIAPGTYYYRVKATDAAGNLSAASAEASGTSTSDTTAPTVSVTAPAAGTVSGAVTLRATANDNVGVSGVQFLIDGNAFGAEDTSAPYEIQWPSTAVANGTHKVSARARDAANNTTTSSEVAVTVNNAPLSNGLVLAYGFEETSGTVVNDSSPAKNNGTAVNGPTSTAAGRFGRALSFDGVNDRVDVPDAASLDLSNAMTLEAWVRPTTNSGWRTALLKERGTNSLVYALYASNGAKPDTENFTSAENIDTAPSALALNTWTHLASTYDGTTLRLFVNGTQVATKAVTGAMPNTANPLRIGGNAIWGEYFSGLIDEVRVYNRALSAGEIGTDMNAAVGP